MSAGEAAGQVLQARQLTELPATAAALADGTIGGAHAQVAVHAARDLPEEALAGLDALVAGQGAGMDAAALRVAVDDYTHRAAPDALEEANGAPGGPGGCSSRVPPMAPPLLTAASTRSARRPSSAPSPHCRHPAAPRTPAPPSSAAPTPSSNSAAAPSTPATCPTWPRSAPTSLSSSTSPPSPPPRRAAGGRRRSTASARSHRRLPGGSAATPASPASSPAPAPDRRTSAASRVVTVAQRRALIVRDRGCVGCSAPAAWAEAHHIKHWANLGPTNLETAGWTGFAGPDRTLVELALPPRRPRSNPPPGPRPSGRWALHAARPPP